MNALSALFNRKKKDILSIYFTAGYPQAENTVDTICSLLNGGADMIEIGMPYSDPVADGPVIQHSSAVSLANGMTIEKLFQQLSQLPEFCKKSPLLLMGYINPVLQFGFERFCKMAKENGISGLIIPDLPLREYKNEFEAIMKRFDLSFIFLITPETSDERIKEMDALSEGFIYAVSASSTTGSHTDEQKKEAYFDRIKRMKLKNPIMIGFGIHDNKSFQQACRYAAGAIIGTAFIRALERGKNSPETVAQFVNEIRSV